MLVAPPQAAASSSSSLAAPPVFVFTTPGCKYCRRAKEALKELQVDFQVCACTVHVNRASMYREAARLSTRLCTMQCAPSMHATWLSSPRLLCPPMLHTCAHTGG